MTQATNSVLVTYLGNSCVLINSTEGTRIVSDPYGSNRPPGLADLPENLSADAVTVSHIHDDHNNINAVNGDPRVLTEPGVFEVGDITVSGLMGWEGSPEGPSETMRNIIFVYEMGGIKIVQLGDSGIITDQTVLTKVMDADLVVVNIDGYVFPHEKILPFMQQIKARTILLAHYTLAGHDNWCGAPTADDFVSKFTHSAQIIRMQSEIRIVPGMPKQIAILRPLTLMDE